jgi:hypothetical protein
MSAALDTGMYQENPFCDFKDSAPIFDAVYESPIRLLR